MTDFWADAEVIHTYSRAQAIEDGALVDVTDTAREAGFTIPVALTAAVWADCVEWPEPCADYAIQDEAGRLWDVIWMARWGVQGNRNTNQFVFELLRIPRKPNHHKACKVQLVCHCGPGDNAEPVLTVMFPGED